LNARVAVVLIAAILSDATAYAFRPRALNAMSISTREKAIKRRWAPRR
jgi:hypothetical protein